MQNSSVKDPNKAKLYKGGLGVFVAGLVLTAIAVYFQLRSSY